MTTRLISSIAGICIVAALCGLFVSLHSDNHEGEPLSYWIMEAPGSDRASAILRRAPKEKVLPILKDWLVATDSPFKLRVITALAKLNVISIRSDLAYRKRFAAINAIVVLGPDAASLADVVGKNLISSGFSPLDVCFALAAMGSNAAPFINPCDPGRCFVGCKAKDAAREIQSTPEFAEALATWKVQTSADIAKLRRSYLRKYFENPPPFNRRIPRSFPSQVPRIPWDPEINDLRLRVAFAEQP